MKTFFVLLSLLVFSLIFTPASARFYSYGELQMKDFEEMQAAVQEKIDKAKSISIAASKQNRDDESEIEETSGTDQEAVDSLREAMKMLLSRPDKDNMVSKLFPMVRRELTNYNAYSDVINGLTTEAISGIQQDKLRAEYRATYIFLLENLMAQLKPEVSSQAVAKEVFGKIKDAAIKIPKEVRQELKLRSMDFKKSPSETAEQVLAKTAK